MHVQKRHHRASIGYWVGEPFWNKGYASESLKEVLVFAFDELKLNKVYAQHESSNLASGRVMQKNGMIKEGELCGHTVKDGVSRDVVQYRLTEPEYRAIISKI